MLRRRTAQQSDEDNLEHRLSAQQYQGSDGAQVVWIRVNEQNCWELLIGCRLAGNRAGLRRVMTNSCATVGTKKQEREEENLSSAAIVELNHVRHTRCIRRTDPSVWRLRQTHLFRAGTSQNELRWSGWCDNGCENLPTPGHYTTCRWRVAWWRLL